MKEKFVGLFLAVFFLAGFLGGRHWEAAGGGASGPGGSGTRAAGQGDAPPPSPPEPTDMRAVFRDVLRDPFFAPHPEFAASALAWLAPRWRLLESDGTPMPALSAEWTPWLEDQKRLFKGGVHEPAVLVTLFWLMRERADRERAAADGPGYDIFADEKYIAFREQMVRRRLREATAAYQPGIADEVVAALDREVARLRDDPIWPFFKAAPKSGWRDQQEMRIPPNYGYATLRNQVEREDWVWNAANTAVLKLVGQWADDLPRRRKMFARMRFFPDKELHWPVFLYLKTPEGQWPALMFLDDARLSLQENYGLDLP